MYVCTYVLYVCMYVCTSISEYMDMARSVNNHRTCCFRPEVTIVSKNFLHVSTRSITDVDNATDLILT